MGWGTFFFTLGILGTAYLLYLLNVFSIFHRILWFIINFLLITPVSVTLTMRIDLWRLLLYTCIAILAFYVRRLAINSRLFSRSKTVAKLENTQNLIQPERFEELDDAESSALLRTPAALELSAPVMHLRTFLETLKIFGFLERQVFEQLADAAFDVTLHPGETMSVSSGDLCVVVSGLIHIQTKSLSPNLLHTRSINLEPNIHHPYSNINQCDPFSTENKHQSDNLTVKKETEWKENTSFLCEVGPQGVISSLLDLMAIFSFDSLSPKKPTHNSNIKDKDLPCDSNCTTDCIIHDEKDSINELCEHNEKILAIAPIASRIMVIPKRTFKQIAQENPSSSAHIVQVLMTRFARVTQTNLRNVLGLSRVASFIEAEVDKFTIPSDFAEKYEFCTTDSRSNSQMNEELVDSPPSDEEVKNNGNKKSQVVNEHIDHDDHLKRNFKVLPKENDKKTKIFSSDIKINENNQNHMARVIDCLLPSASDLSQASDNPSLHKRLRKRILAYVLCALGCKFSTKKLNQLKSNKELIDEVLVQLSIEKPVSLFNEESFHKSLKKMKTELQGISLRSVQPGCLLARQGDRDPGIYVLLEGTLQYSSTGSTPGQLYGIYTNTGSATDSQSNSKSTGHLAHIDDYKINISNRGALCGTLGALLGQTLTFNLLTVGNSSAMVAYLDKSTVERLVDAYPSILHTMAARLICAVPAFTRAIDCCIQWIHLPAGQTLINNGDAVSGIYTVLHGRLTGSTSNQSTPNHFASNPGYNSDTTTYSSFASSRSFNGQKFLGQKNDSHIVEFGGGDRLGQRELLAGDDDPRWFLNLRALRDSELSLVPRKLFEMLASLNPATALSLSRSIASLNSGISLPYSINNYPRAQSNPNYLPRNSKNIHVKCETIRTVAILPVSEEHRRLTTQFARNLQHELSLLDVVSLLDSQIVVSQMGKHAFSAIGKLKLVEWLKNVEESHRLVVYLADGAVTSRWTRRCIRQADCIFLVADASCSNQGIGSYERLLLGSGSSARKELVLVHAKQNTAHGFTRSWLVSRPYLTAFHHVRRPPLPKGRRDGHDSDTLILDDGQFMEDSFFHNDSAVYNLMKNKSIENISYVYQTDDFLGENGVKDPQISKINRLRRFRSISSVLDKGDFIKQQLAKKTNALWGTLKRRVTAALEPNQFKTTLGTIMTSGSTDDYCRLARRLLGRGVGIVFSGGGARGLAHLGVLQALVESGVPVDAVGGTSMGAMIAALYARDMNIYTALTFARRFSRSMSSRLSYLMDLTYPITSWFTGNTFNRQVQTIFGTRLIEDLWLPFFAISTDISYLKQQCHQSGLVWRYVRASMSLCAFLPPLCDSGSLLVDGGYLNNLPADVMFGVSDADLFIDGPAHDSTITHSLSATRSAVGGENSQQNSSIFKNVDQNEPKLTKVINNISNINTVIAIDVANTNDPDFTQYGDSLSGLYLLIIRLLKIFLPPPVAKFLGLPHIKIPTLPDIQLRLAFIGCAAKMDSLLAEFGSQINLNLDNGGSDANVNQHCIGEKSSLLYTHTTPVLHFRVLDFECFSEIHRLGLEHGQQLVGKWRRDGTLRHLRGHRTTSFGIASTCAARVFFKSSPMDTPISECQSSLSPNHSMNQPSSMGSVGDPSLFCDTENHEIIVGKFENSESSTRRKSI